MKKNNTLDMKTIIEKMRDEVIRRSNEFEAETSGTKDEYNLYREHIQHVHRYAVLLAQNRILDTEVLELSALLHDISMTNSSSNRSLHNEFSADIAEKLLLENDYPANKTALVKKCILNHSKRRQEFRTTVEEEMLVNADGLSHFDSILSIYSLAHKVMELDEAESVKFVQKKLTGDYFEISDKFKSLVEDKYEKVISAKAFDDLVKIN